MNLHAFIRLYFCIFDSNYNQNSGFSISNSLIKFIEFKSARTFFQSQPECKCNISSEFLMRKEEDRFRFEKSFCKITNILIQFRPLANTRNRNQNEKHMWCDVRCAREQLLFRIPAPISCHQTNFSSASFIRTRISRYLLFCVRKICIRNGNRSTAERYYIFGLIPTADGLGNNSQVNQEWKLSCICFATLTAGAGPFCVEAKRKKWKF